ncbi:MAG: hypothetical protein SNJ82_03095 [Gemmataceae bacterium]
MTKETHTVTVKLYGLFALSRRRYLFQLLVAVGLMAALLAGWWYAWADLRERLRELPVELPAWIVPFGNSIPWILLVALVLQLLEAWMVLRCFAAKKPASSSPSSSPSTETTA